jgi:hypothetical protein
MSSNIRRFKRNKIIVAVLPILTLFLSVTLWGIISFIGMALGGSADSGFFKLISDLINLLLPLLIGLCVVFIPSGIFAAFYFNRKEKQEAWTEYDKRSGLGEGSIIPEELKNWNWGAAFLGIFWGPYFGVWRAFLMMIPLVNIVYFFILGFEGSELAWRENIAAIVVFVLSILVQLASL